MLANRTAPRTQICGGSVQQSGMNAITTKLAPYSETKLKKTNPIPHPYYSTQATYRKEQKRDEVKDPTLMFLKQTKLKTEVPTLKCYIKQVCCKKVTELKHTHTHMKGTEEEGGKGHGGVKRRDTKRTQNSPANIMVQLK